MMHILICSVGNHLFALDLIGVEYIVLAVEISALAKGPKHIAGAINVHGEITPVIDMRVVLGLPQKELELKDLFILCRLQEKRQAFWVDSVKEVRSCSPEELIPAKQIFPEMDAVEYVLKNDEGIVLLYDFDKLFAVNALSSVKLL